MVLSLQQSLILIIGIMITSGLFYLILYFGFRQKIALLFISLFCFCQAAKAFCRTDAALAQTILNISQAQAKICTSIVYTLGSFLLIGFIVFQFDLKKKWLILVTTAVMLLSFYALSWPQLPVVIAGGILLSAWAFNRERLGSVLAVLGLATFGVASFFEMSAFNKVGYFMGIIAFVILITIFVGHQIREQIRAQRQALLRSSTLENQLLKKSLQPHFLFNSLMSLQEWIEQQPARAAQFVQALAEEFRAVSSMSGNKLIPINDELRMCEAHLQIMGYRRNGNFKLEVEGISGDETVPPAIFHTLVENGLTHGYAQRAEGCFKLSKTSHQHGVRYQLYNNGCSQKTSSNGSSGTGLRYVESRLEESYPGKWKLHSKAVDDGWMVSIDLLN